MNAMTSFKERQWTDRTTEEIPPTVRFSSPEVIIAACGQSRTFDSHGLFADEREEVGLISRHTVPGRQIVLAFAAR